jgi:hypothetical protein
MHKPKFISFISSTTCCIHVQFLRSPHWCSLFLLQKTKVVSQKMFHTNWSSILLILSTMFKVCLKFYRMCNKDVALSVQSFHKLWIQTVAVVLATRKSPEAEADQWKSHRCHNLHLKGDTNFSIRAFILLIRFT